MSRRTIYQDIMDGLKKILKGRKLNYSQAARALDLSESSVKRLFNAKDGHLSKVESLCDWLDVDISDVLALNDKDQMEDYVLSSQQEAFFLEYPGALQFYLEIVEYDHTAEEIKDIYHLNDASMTFYLNRLEDHGFIEVFPGNIIKNKVENPIVPTGKGALSKKLLRSSLANIAEVTIKMMDQPNSPNSERRATVKTGEMLFSKSSTKEILEEYLQFNEKMAKLSRRDTRLYPKKELTPHMYFNAFIPQRMFTERIPNVDKKGKR